MTQFTTLTNESVNTILTTIKPLTGNYSNHTNHSEVDNKNDSKVILIVILIVSFIVCSLLEGFHKVITGGNESFLIKVIKSPFIIILSIPNFMIIFVMMPFGVTLHERYVEWRKRLKQYWYITCLSCINRVFNMPQEETLPQHIAEAYIDETNKFFSDEYDTIEYPHEEIDVCSICMDKLDANCDKNEKVILLKCGHCFHEQCLKSWYKSSVQKNCPVCRETLEIKNYYNFKEI